MNDLGFAWYLVTVLATRVTLVIRDEPLKAWDWAAMVLFQSVGFLLFAPMLSAGILLSAVLIVNLLEWLAERHAPTRIALARIATLLLLTGIGTVAFSSASGLTFNPTVLEWLRMASRWNLALDGVDAAQSRQALFVLAGLLFVMGDSNHLIRWILKKFSVLPRTGKTEDGKGEDTKSRPEDTREFNRGRIIGLFERGIIYLLVLLGQYAAIGFVLAAKSFTRFKELDQRDFAEYVLIGTLLSSMVAVAAGLIVKTVLAA